MLPDSEVWFQTRSGNLVGTRTSGTSLTGASILRLPAIMKYHARSPPARDQQVPDNILVIGIRTWTRQFLGSRLYAVEEEVNVARARGARLDVFSFAPLDFTTALGLSPVEGRYGVNQTKTGTPHGDTSTFDPGEKRRTHQRGQIVVFTRGAGSRADCMAPRAVLRVERFHQGLELRTTTAPATTPRNTKTDRHTQESKEGSTIPRKRAALRDAEKKTSGLLTPSSSRRFHYQTLLMLGTRIEVTHTYKKSKSETTEQ